MALPICCACKNFAHLFHQYKCDLDFDLKPQLFFTNEKNISWHWIEIYMFMGYQYPLTNNQPLSNCQILVVLISSKNCLDLKKKNHENLLFIYRVWNSISYSIYHSGLCM